MKKIYFNTFVIMVVIITLINFAFYWTSRDTLIKKEAEINESISKSVKSTVETNQKSVETFESLIAQQLYTDALLINNELPSMANQVSQAQLKLLANKLQLDEIAILVPDHQWFDLVQSSSTAEVGTNSKMWGNRWNRMFFQLVQKKNVTPVSNFGEVYPHFWSGPFDTSSNIPNKVFKTSYYYDGTKNYIIEPIFDGKKMVDYQNEAGVDAAIKSFIKNNPTIKEISVLNFNRLTGNFNIAPGELWRNRLSFHNREVINGTYNYASIVDKNVASQAIQQNKTIYQIAAYKGNQILQFYIPIQITIDGNAFQYKTIIISSVDYSQISHELRKGMIQLSLVVILCFIICFALIYTLFRYIRKQGKLLSEIQNLYAGKVNSLYQTIREYRHDVANHIFTIQGLLSLKHYSEAEKYTKQLSHIHRETSAIVNIHIPALIGLMQVKIAEGIEKNIKFDHHFEGFEYLDLDIEKTTNLVKVLGNILNNSFYEVGKKDEGNRSVAITGKAMEKKLQFCIQNNGDMIPPDLLEKIFDFGFTTKSEGSGIGLASAKKIIEQYKGTITVSSDPEWTTFTIELPLSNKEFVPDPILKGKMNRKQEG